MREVGDDVHRREAGVAIGGGIATVIVDEVIIGAAAFERVRAAVADDRVADEAAWAMAIAAGQMIIAGGADHRPRAAGWRRYQPFRLVDLVADARRAEDGRRASVPQRNIDGPGGEPTETVARRVGERIAETGRIACRRRIGDEPGGLIEGRVCPGDR